MKSCFQLVYHISFSSGCRECFFIVQNEETIHTYGDRKHFWVIKMLMALESDQTTRQVTLTIHIRGGTMRKL